jgi:hypothetical protein
MKSKRCPMRDSTPKLATGLIMKLTSKPSTTNDYYVVLSGNGFNPSELLFLSNCRVNNSENSGWINRSGKTMEHGYLQIDGDGIIELCEIAKRVIDVDPSVTEVQLWLARYHKSQCNLEFEREAK